MTCTIANSEQNSHTYGARAANNFYDRFGVNFSLPIKVPLCFIQLKTYNVLQEIIILTPSIYILLERSLKAVFIKLFTEFTQPLDKKLYQLKALEHKICKTTLQKYNSLLWKTNGIFTNTHHYTKQQ